MKFNGQQAHHHRDNKIHKTNFRDMRLTEEPKNNDSKEGNKSNECD